MDTAPPVAVDATSRSALMAEDRRLDVDPTAAAVIVGEIEQLDLRWPTMCGADRAGATRACLEAEPD